MVNPFFKLVKQATNAPSPIQYTWGSKVGDVAENTYDSIMEAFQYAPEHLMMLRICQVRDGVITNVIYVEPSVAAVRWGLFCARDVYPACKELDTEKYVFNTLGTVDLWLLDPSSKNVKKLDTLCNSTRSVMDKAIEVQNINALYAARAAYFAACVDGQFFGYSSITASIQAFTFASKVNIDNNYQAQLQALFLGEEEEDEAANGAITSNIFYKNYRIGSSRAFNSDTNLTTPVRDRDFPNYNDLHPKMPSSFFLDALLISCMINMKFYQTPQPPIDFKSPEAKLFRILLGKISKMNYKITFDKDFGVEGDHSSFYAQCILLRSTQVHWSQDDRIRHSKTTDIGNPQTFPDLSTCYKLFASEWELIQQIKLTKCTIFDEMQKQRPELQCKEIGSEKIRLELGHYHFLFDYHKALLPIFIANEMEWSKENKEDDAVQTEWQALLNRLKQVQYWNEIKLEWGDALKRIKKLVLAKPLHL